MAELVRDARRGARGWVKRPSTSVSQRTTRRLGPSPIASAFGSDVDVVHGLDVDRHVADVLLRLERVAAARSAGVVQPVRRRQVRADEREEQREPDEHRRGGKPPAVAELAREAHDDREREAEEHELAAEREPVAEEASRSRRS